MLDVRCTYDPLIIRDCDHLAASLAVLKNDCLVGRSKNDSLLLTHSVHKNEQ